MLSINHDGIHIKLKDLNTEHNPNHIHTLVSKYKKYFTIRTNLIGNYYTTNIQYEYKNGIIKIPRFSLLELLNNKSKLRELNLRDLTIDNKIMLTNQQKQIFVWNGQLKNNQPLVFDTIINNYFNDDRVSIGMAGVILNLEAGQGKTFVAMALINRLQLKTLVICHNESVLYDWSKEVTRLFPNNIIGYQYGKKKQDGDIVISIVNSLLKPDLPSTFFDQFGFIVYDEVHMYCSQELSRVFRRAQATYVLGLSATPNERNDKFDQVAWWNVGPVLEARLLPGYTEKDIPFKGRVKMVRYVGADEYTQHMVNAKTGLTDAVGMLSALIQDPSRLDCICQEIILLLQQSNDHNIFVFADRKVYLDNINDRLKQLYEQDDLSTVILENVSKLTGGARSDDIKDAELNARVILTTYQYMSVGKSIPKMNAIVLATPRKSHSRQIINRIFRLGSDYSIERQIIDIVDQRTIFKNQWYKRAKYYKEKKYEIEIVDY